MDYLSKGKKIVVSIIVFVLLVDIVSIAITSSLYLVNDMVEKATFKIIQGLFRLVLEGVILFFLYSGHKWAKWLICILFLMGGLFSLVSTVATFSIIMLLLGVIYIFAGVILLSSKAVKEFFDYQRNGKVNDLNTSSNDF